MTDKKKLLKKKEKHIREVVLPSGAHVLRIEIRKHKKTEGKADDKKDEMVFRHNLQMKDFATPAAALEAAVRIRDQKLVEFNLAEKTEDLKSVEELYQKSFELLPRSLNTRKNYDVFYNQVVAPYGDRLVQDIRRSDIQTSINEFAETHCREYTAKALACWKRVYKAAAVLEMDIPDRTVGVVVPKGTPAKHRKKDISAEDLETFCEALLSYNAASISGSYNCHAVYYAIRIMQHCGLRPAEVFALLRTDIDLQKMVIHVNKSVRSSKDEFITIGETKTKRGVRDVPIPDALVSFLTECLEWSRHDDYLLADYTGKIFDTGRVSTMILNVRKEKCPGIDFQRYMLRHQFSTDLHRSGVPSPVVRDLMGHESAGQSIDYAVSYPEDRKKAVDSRKFYTEKEGK